MPVPSRFGRKLPLPPVTVIKHQLRMMTAADSLTEALRGEKGSPMEIVAVIRGLAEKYHLSTDRAYMLTDRLKVDRAMLGVI